MSQENVEVVRAMMAAFLRGDYDSAMNALDRGVVGDFTHMPDGGETGPLPSLGRERQRVAFDSTCPG
jgi:hypothetical protein